MLAIEEESKSGDVVVRTFDLLKCYRCKYKVMKKRRFLEIKPSYRSTED